MKLEPIRNTKLKTDSSLISDELNPEMQMRRE
jgi:hypothetical protein